MDLHKTLPDNFRYYLITTKSKEIIILFYKHGTNFNSHDEQCVVETTYLQMTLKHYAVDSAQTIKVTCNENETSIDKFNNEIVNYCNSRQDMKQVRIYNCSIIDYRVLFESKVFKAIASCTKDIYIDINDSGLRIGRDDFGQLSKIYIKKGRIYPDSTATIYVNEFSGLECLFDVANKSEEEHVVNIVITKKMMVNSIRQYAPISMVISAGNMKAEDFSDSKFMCCCYELYGQERMESNENIPRMTLLGVKKANIGEMMISEETTYGNVFKVDRVTNFNIGSVNRTVTEVSKGSFITVGRVGSVSLHKINYNVTPTSVMADDSSVVYFLPDENSGLSRSLNIFDTNVVGVRGLKFNVVKLASCDVDKVFISDCTIHDGVTLLSYDETSSINRLNYNDCKIYGQNIIFKGAMNLSITNSDINARTVDIEVPYISLSGGIWNFEKFIITRNDYISKINFIDCEFVGKEMSIENPTLENDAGVLYDTKSAFDIETLSISGYKPSFTDSNFRMRTVNIDTIETLTLSGVKAYFTRDDMDLNCYGSISGSMYTIPSSNNSKFKLNIADKNKHLSMNPLTITGSINSPSFDVVTNVPVKLKFESYTNPKIYASYTSDFDSKQDSKLIFGYCPNVTHKVITNGEKYTNVTKTEENGLLTYILSKKGI